MSSKENDNITLSQRDIELIVGAMKSAKSEFTIDFDRFAKNVGFKNANTARTQWAGVKKKLDKFKDGSGIAAGTPDGTRAPTPTSGKKRKSAAPDADADDEETPAPKKGKRGRKAKAEGESTPVKKDKAAKDDSPAGGSESEAKVKDESDSET